MFVYLKSLVNSLRGEKGQGMVEYAIIIALIAIAAYAAFSAFGTTISNAISSATTKVSG